MTQLPIRNPIYRAFWIFDSYVSSGVFEAFESEGLMARAEAQGRTIMARMKAVKAKGKGMPIGDIRGLGAMCAFELVTEHGGNTPDAGAAKALAAKCLERGLLILTCGIHSDTIRLLTPLTASETILNEGLDIIEAAVLGN